MTGNRRIKKGAQDVPRRGEEVDISGNRRSRRLGLGIRGPLGVLRSLALPVRSKGKGEGGGAPPGGEASVRPKPGVSGGKDGVAGGLASSAITTYNIRGCVKPLIVEHKDTGYNHANKTVIAYCRRRCVREEGRTMAVTKPFLSREHAYLLGTLAGYAGGYKV